jgi:hypothetical protein
MKTRLIVSGICLLYIFICYKSAVKGGDFDVFLDAAQKLNNGENIYAPPFFNGLQYFYSPLFALLLIPFTNYFFSIELAWLMLSGFLFYRTGKLIFKYFDLTVLTKKEKIVLLVITVFFSLRFLLYNIAMIQITIFLLWGIFESIHLIKKDKWVIGSLLLALVINIKIMPIVILPYLIYRGKFKATAATLVFSAIFLVLPALYIGYDFNAFLLAEWWKIVNPGNNEHMIEIGVNAQSFVGIIPVFISETGGDMHVNRNFLSFSIGTAVIITNIVRLIFVAFTIYFLDKPFLKAKSSLSEVRALAYICLLIPLIFPHQQKYAFIFVFPMIVYLSYYCVIMWKLKRDRNFKLFLMPLLVVSILYTPFIGSDLLGRYNYDLLHHFRLLGISLILLIVFAILGSPNKLQKVINSALKN